MRATPESKKAASASRRKLLAAIRAAVKAGGGKTLTYTKFLATTKLPAHHVFRHFSRWNDALRAAGFKFERFNAPVTSARLLEDWGRAVRRHGRIPTHLEHNLCSKHSPTTYIKRFGAWSKIPEAFRAFARRRHKWRDVLTLLPPQNKLAPRKNCHPGRSGAQPRGLPVLPSSPSQTSYAYTHPVQTISHSSRPRRGRSHKSDIRLLPGRGVCGPRIPLESLSHAPVNEAGVLFLFALMARDLGFVVESLKAGYPDCEAKRLIPPDTWQTVRIEFEYMSRNFRDHRHDPAGCDIIVCWIHNWEECPKNIEVIALKEKIAPLGRT